MSQTVITQAFEALKAQEAANGGVVMLDEFVFASVPNLNITDPISRTEGLPPAAQIVHRQAVSKTGMVNSNAVVYSVVLGADVGDFEFNWVGLLNKASGVVAMIVHAPSQKKIRTQSGQQGNVLTRSFLMEYNGASQQTQIITPADTWQIDFTARLNGVDERIRHENIDAYGHASFLNDGFLVSGKNGDYLVKKGVAYIEGLRAELLFDQAVAIAARPSKIWVDVCWRGTLTSVWAAATKITVADSLVNYVAGDEQHYVCAIADILADGSVVDLRPASAMAQMVGLSVEPNVIPYFDENSKLKKSAISDYARELIAIPDADGVVSVLGLKTELARLRDEGDVRGWGAIGDGVADDTAAFVSTLTIRNKAYVPAGTFLVNMTAVDINRLYGVGDILTSAGIRIAIPKFRDHSTMILAKMVVPNFGFNNGTTDTSIYPGARNALQGISALEIGGVTKVFMAQRVSGGAWTASTRCRISQIDLKNDGSTVPVTQYSQEINIGHGIDLSARIEGGEIYLYASQPVDPLYPDDKAGKGYARIHWRGTATSQADVESFTLWGQPGSGHRFEKYNRATAKISDDGKWLIMASAPINQGAVRQIIIYDFAKVVAASDKTKIEPAYITEFSTPSTQGGNVIQGVMSDGRSLTVSVGGTVVLSPNYVAEMGFDGTEYLFQKHEAALDQYGLSGILNNSTYGFPWRFEPEGVCSYKGGRLISVAEGWYASAKVVTWMGYNWACITPSDTTGVPPSNGSYWVRTTKPATDGAWSSTGNYANTSNFSHEVKTIYYIGPSLGLAQENRLVTGIHNQDDPSEITTGQGSGANSIGFQWRNELTIRGWAAALNQFFDAMRYDTSSRLRIYDAQEGADNTQYASAQAQFNNTIKALILRGGGLSVADSAVMRLHKRDDPNYPGYIVEGTRVSGEFTRETDANGATRFASAPGSTPVTACRPDDGMMYGFEKTRNANLWGLYRGTGSPEGVIAAPRGSLYVAATGAPATFYVKESGTGNTGWEAK